MTTYNQLRKEFEEKVKKLRASCNHKRLTKWTKELDWHFNDAGTTSRACNACGKEIYRRERKRKCVKCGRIDRWAYPTCLRCGGRTKELFITTKLGKVTKEEEAK